MGFSERTVSELMRNRAETYGSKPFFYFMDSVFTYETVYDLSTRIASALRKLGVKHGDRVVVGLPNIPEMILSFTGIAQSGASYVAVNVKHSERELIYFLKHSEATAIIAFEQVVEKILPHKDELPFLKEIIQVGGETPEGILDFEELLTEENKLEGCENPSDIFMLSYTSGTTGRPKGVISSFERVINNANRVAEATHMNEEDVSVNMLPYTHVFAPVTEWLSMLGVGGSFVLRDKFTPWGVLQDVKSHNGSYLMGAPPMYMTILNEYKRNADRYDLSTIRFSMAASDTLPERVQSEFEKITDAPMIQGGGQTESVLAAIEPLERPKGYHPGSFGTNIWDDIEIKVVDEYGNEVSEGEVGEFIVKSPDNMLGYWKMPEETENTIVNGWLHTGDLVRMDGDGYVYMVDRMKNMIKTSSEKVYPAEIEKVLYMLSEIEETTVIGVPDKLRGESIEAYIKLAEGAESDKESILEHCRENLAPYKVPRKVHFTDELPKTVTKKIRKFELKNQVLEGKR